eukprot:2493134-Prymnesium_polylepis.1
MSKPNPDGKGVACSAEGCNVMDSSNWYTAGRGQSSAGRATARRTSALAQRRAHRAASEWRSSRRSSSSRCS